MKNNSINDYVNICKSIAATFSVAWFLVLLLGSLLVSTYFTQINYFPLSDWQSIFSILLFAVIKGTSILLILALCMIFSPLYWGVTMIDVFWDSVRDVGSKIERPDEISCIYFISNLILVPTIIYLINTLKVEVSIQFVLLNMLILITIMININGKIKFYNSTNLLISQLIKKWCLLFALIINSTFSAALLCLGLAVIYPRIIGGGVELWGSVFLTILIPSICLNFLMRKVNSLYIFILIALVVLFIAITGMSKFIMQGAKIGGFYATLVVNKEACSILKSRKYLAECGQKVDFYNLNNVYILWRGNEYYLKYCNNNGLGESFVLPSSQIKAIFPNNKNKRFECKK